MLDTAPTGHTLLLMDATGAYHRQMTREFEAIAAARVVTPLMRLQDPAYTRIVLVTLPEITPVSEAASTARRPASGKDRAVRLGGQSQPGGLGHPGPSVGRTSGR